MDYILSRYSTGPKESAEQAVESLEEYLETVSLTVVNRGVLRRDTSFIGWVLLRGGLNPIKSVHEIVTAGFSLTQLHTLVVASAHHTHTAPNLTATQLHALVVADSAHVHTIGGVVIVANPAVHGSYHDHASPNLTVVEV